MKASRRAMGIEAELSVTAFDRNGSALPIEVALERFFDAASGTLTSIPRRDDCDLFLANGMRLYRDCGGHPEAASPETTDPAQAVRYAAAMRQILSDVVTEIENRHSNIGELFLTACNINYANACATMGRHESYSYQRLPPAITLREELVPFLASRVILHGAGGFDPKNQGIQFLVSPRATFIRHEVSGESTADRAILHTKDETLAKNGYHRLHLIVGEYQCCHLGMWLTMGTTALVLALAEAGIATGNNVALRWPVQALKAFAADTECRTRVRLAGGRRLTAIEIQRHYLEQAERHCGRRILPAWAPEVCAAWREMLDRLEEAGSAAATDRLDWGVKLSLFKSHAKRRYGFDWDDLPYWSGAIRTISRVLYGRGVAEPADHLTDIFDLDDTTTGSLNQVRGFLESKGVEFSRERMQDFLDLRAELFQLDMRFSQIGKRGIFDGLDAVDGLLHHRLPAVTDVAAAKNEPPQDTRAKLRGDCVRQFSGRPGYRCDWHTVYDRNGGRQLDLSDPFATSAQWQVTTEEEPRTPEDVIRMMNERRRIMRERGEERQRRRAAQAPPPPPAPPPSPPPEQERERERARARALDRELLARILM